MLLNKPLSSYLAQRIILLQNQTTLLCNDVGLALSIQTTQPSSIDTDIRMISFLPLLWNSRYMVKVRKSLHYEATSSVQWPWSYPWTVKAHWGWTCNSTLPDLLIQLNFQSLLLQMLTEKILGNNNKKMVAIFIIDSSCQTTSSAKVRNSQAKKKKLSVLHCHLWKYTVVFQVPTMIAVLPIRIAHPLLWRLFLRMHYPIGKNSLVKAEMSLSGRALA